MAAQKSLNEDYKSDGKWKEIWRRFKKNKGAVIGLVLLVVLTVILVGAPLFISYDKAITQNMDLMLAKPSVGNLFGNDGYGRDIFARIIYGGRVSIAIAILATISSCLFGSLLGAVAGYFGGKVDSIIMRSLDIFMSVPDRVACDESVKLAKEVDNIVAIKAATGNLSQESKTMMLAEGCLDMYSGEDGLIVPLMSIGAKGVISVLSNVAPKQTHDICAEFFAGNIEKSRQLQFEALELVDALFCEVNPIPVKTALNLMGMEVGPLRMPLCEMEEANLNKLKTALKNYGLIK